MRIFKRKSILALLNSFVIDSTQPSNLPSVWEVGSLLAVCLVLKKVTGVNLALHFTPYVYTAFVIVEHN
jgi:quinol-cytochrome oxidoreductase complex cytochrome b subunit